MIESGLSKSVFHIPPDELAQAKEKRRRSEAAQALQPLPLPEEIASPSQLIDNQNPTSNPDEFAVGSLALKSGSESPEGHPLGVPAGDSEGQVGALDGIENGAPQEHPGTSGKGPNRPDEAPAVNRDGLGGALDGVENRAPHELSGASGNGPNRPDTLEAEGLTAAVEEAGGHDESPFASNAKHMINEGYTKVLP